MKYILFILLCIVLVSCGNKKPDDSSNVSTIKADTTEMVVRAKNIHKLDSITFKIGVADTANYYLEYTGAMFPSRDQSNNCCCCNCCNHKKHHR